MGQCYIDGALRDSQTSYRCRFQEEAWRTAQSRLDEGVSAEEPIALQDLKNLYSYWSAPWVSDVVEGEGFGAGGVSDTYRLTDDSVENWLMSQRETDPAMHAQLMAVKSAIDSFEVGKTPEDISLANAEVAKALAAVK
jgi:hypothetical protein